VRAIEHGNLIDDASAKLMAENNMFLTANLVAYYAMKERAAEFGMTGDMLAKNDLVIDGGLRSLEICKRAGVPVAYGSDLLGQLQVDQSREFLLRREVLSPIEIIRSATTVGAQLLRMEGKLGTLRAGAFADMILVDGDPLKDLEPLPGPGRAPAGDHEGRQVPQEHAALSSAVFGAPQGAPLRWNHHRRAR
jgi:imidazolonepropionase-like amidohydrolase